MEVTLRGGGAGWAAGQRREGGTGSVAGLAPVLPAPLELLTLEVINMGVGQ